MSETENCSENVSGTPRITTSGMRFGMLIVEEEFRRDGQSWWVCLCDCGGRSEVRKGSLVAGRSTSCGCRRRRKPDAPGAHVRLWRIWTGMRYRCRDGGDYWKQRGYAGRGISVCPEWEAYRVFAAWAIANGYADALSIDRRDNDGDYEPGNCRWINNKVQTRNTRRTVWVEHGGARVSLAEAVEELGLEYHAVYNRHVRAGRAFADVIDEMQGGPPIIDTLNPKCRSAAC